MSVSAAQSSAFFTEVPLHGEVFAIRDDGGFPAPKNRSGARAMPFWSRESRARKIIENVSAYQHFIPVRLTLAEFRDKWIPDLSQDGLQIGANWSGLGATGYDFTPAEVLAGLDARLHSRSSGAGTLAPNNPPVR
ncbi:DUF2750 domain-containing protein [Microbacterium sp. NPDC058389]|uniref:DUF2750 domain-containing protein n=1 Tax=Microbacterium sp. NPDC058389 TaxID=3346475 RepID=UPI0036649090